MNSTPEKNVLKRIFKVSPEGKGLLFLSCLSSTIGMLLSVVPYLSVYYIGKYFLNEAQTDSGIIAIWVIIAGVSILGNMIFTFLGSIGSHVVAFRLLFQYRLKAMKHMSRLSMGFFSTHTSGSIQKTMDENIENIENFIAHMLPDLVGSFIVLMALILGIGYLNIYMALIAILSIVVAFAAQSLIFGASKSKQLWADIIKSNQNISGAFSEYIHGIAEIKLFGQTGKLTKNLAHHIEEHLKWETKSYKRATLPMSFYKSVVLSLITFVFPIGIVMIASSPTQHNILAVLMTLIVLPAIYDPLVTCVEYGTQMGMLNAGLNQIDQILNEPILKSEKVNNDLKNFDVVFDDVSFSYQNKEDPLRQMALSNISLHAKQKQIMALVGESGSGKSTIAQLLLRFWDIESGEIKIGGINIKQLSSEVLMNNIAPVFQDTYIFADTIKGNISMNLPFSDEAIIDAAKRARCHTFIEKMAQGYDTKVGSGGVKLSGGEAQRISIARAMLKNPPIIILDEALAYTDAENENVIQAAIKDLVKDKTLIVIAHQLRSIVDADQIIVLKNGQIVEQGRHQELMQEGTEYKTLWDFQNQANRWKIEKKEQTNERNHS